MTTTSEKQAIAGGVTFSPREDRLTAISNNVGRTFKFQGSWYGINQRRRVKAFSTKGMAQKWANTSR